MQQGTPQLIMWSISGNRTHYEAFLGLGLMERQNQFKLWDHHSLNGVTGVSNGIQIPFQFRTCRRCSKFPS